MARPGDRRGNALLYTSAHVWSASAASTCGPTMPPTWSAGLPSAPPSGLIGRRFGLIGGVGPALKRSSAGRTEPDPPAGMDRPDTGLRKHETPQTFAVTWDYRCPFARTAHEHVLDGLEAGAAVGRDVRALLPQSVHVPEGGTPAWDDPAHQPDLLALAAGVVVRDRFPDTSSPCTAPCSPPATTRAATSGNRRWSARRPGPGRRRRRRGAGRGRRGLAGQADPRGARALVAELDVFGVPTFIVGRRRRLRPADGPARGRRASWPATPSTGCSA